MKYFDWDDSQNVRLRRERGIGYEDIVFHIGQGDLLDVLEHTRTDCYPGLAVLVVRRDRHVFLVPTVESGDRVFLKTIIPSDRATNRMLEPGLPG